ncbi:hypothetical protein M5689_006677 [Euphorbia peplus]|nr:hypothetical protein M5689_006677 [Euphorbia peplus]
MLGIEGMFGIGGRANFGRLVMLDNGGRPTPFGRVGMFGRGGRAAGLGRDGNVGNAGCGSAGIVGIGGIAAGLGRFGNVGICRRLRAANPRSMLEHDRATKREKMTK